jgi:calnexin
LYGYVQSIGSVGAVALEIWTMSKGLVVDNVLVAADETASSELEKLAWKPKHDALKKIVAA